MVMTFDSSRRPCDSDAFATSSYEMNFAQPLSADTLVRAAVRVVLPWSMWPMVPTLTCGLLRSNFSLAMSSTPLRFYPLVAVHLRSHAIHASFGGQPSPGLPTVAHAPLGRRERRLEPMTRIELVTSSLPRTRSAN